MDSYSLNNLKYTITDNGEYIRDVFQKTVVDNKKKTIFTTVVKENESMRIDRISDRIYGSTKYVEDLMVLNNIINPWSVKAGDEFKYFSLEDREKMHEYDDSDDIKNAIKEKLVNPNKNTRKDPTRKNNLAPTTKPSNVKSLDINTDNHKIKIINKFG